MSAATLAHTDIEQLLGAFVLHAVDADEFALIEQHLEDCPRCSSEVDDRNEIAAALGNIQAVVPAQLWDRIAGQLSGPPEQVEPAEGAVIARFDEATPRPGRATLLRFSAIAAAAAVIALLAVGLVNANGRLAHAQSALGARAAQAQLQAALSSPGHQVVELHSGTNAHLAEFVVADGVGYAVTSAMPTLPADETYQLWASIGGQPISLGLLGDRVERGAAFSLRSTQGRAVGLLVTVEPAGGVVVPDRAPIASGRIIDA
jgi:anti-sigma factor RsiW